MEVQGVVWGICALLPAGPWGTTGDMWGGTWTSELVGDWPVFDSGLAYIQQGAHRFVFVRRMSQWLQAIRYAGQDSSKPRTPPLVFSANPRASDLFPSGAGVRRLRLCSTSAATAQTAAVRRCLPCLPRRRQSGIREDSVSSAPGAIRRVL